MSFSFRLDSYYDNTHNISGLSGQRELPVHFRHANHVPGSDHLQSKLNRLELRPGREERCQQLSH